MTSTRDPAPATEFKEIPESKESKELQALHAKQLNAYMADADDTLTPLTTFDSKEWAFDKREPNGVFLYRASSNKSEFLAHPHFQKTYETADTIITLSCQLVRIWNKPTAFKDSPTLRVGHELFPAIVMNAKLYFYPLMGEREDEALVIARILSKEQKPTLYICHIHLHTGIKVISKHTAEFMQIPVGLIQPNKIILFAPGGKHQTAQLFKYDFQQNKLTPDIGFIFEDIDTLQIMPGGNTWIARINNELIGEDNRLFVYKYSTEDNTRTLLYSGVDYEVAADLKNFLKGRWSTNSCTRQEMSQALEQHTPLAYPTINLVLEYTSRNRNHFFQREFQTPLTRLHVKNGKGKIQVRLEEVPTLRKLHKLEEKTQDQELKKLLRNFADDINKKFEKNYRDLAEEYLKHALLSTSTDLFKTARENEAIKIKKLLEEFLTLDNKFLKLGVK